MQSDDPHGSSKLDALGARIEQERREAGLIKEDRAAHSASIGVGFRVAIELVVAVCVGTALGFGAGSLFGQEVIGLILGLAIGFAAGLKTVYQTTMAATESQRAPEEDRQRAGEREHDGG